MDNQHRKIVFYRELSQEDIDLMNEIKAAGNVLIELHKQVIKRITRQIRRMERVSYDSVIPDYERFTEAEPVRWAAIGKTDIQTGVMALVRAVAQPTDV